MANINHKLPQSGKKVSRSASTAILKPAEVLASAGAIVNGTVSIGDVLTVLTLPANVDVTNAYIHVVKAPTGGTQTLQISLGATSVIAAVAVGSVDGVFKGGTVTKANSGSGADVTITTGVADLTDGEFRLVVEYVEYTKVTGELTN